MDRECLMVRTRKEIEMLAWELTVETSASARGEIEAQLNGLRNCLADVEGEESMRSSRGHATTTAPRDSR